MSLKKLIIALAASTVATPTAMATSLSADRADLENARGAELIEHAAQPYIAFRQDIEDVSRAIPSDAKSMRDAHMRLASHDSRAVSTAFIAYAAMVAADTPRFAAEIEKRTKRRRTKTAFLQELADNPVMIRSIPGAQEAIDAVMKVSAQDANRVRQAGDAFIAAAYGMQDKPWARRAIALNGMARVDEALTFAATRRWSSLPASPGKATRSGMMRPYLSEAPMWSVSWAGEEASPAPNATGGSVATKALLLGARYAMNEVSRDDLAAYAVSKKTERCFTNAKLNLDQCIAATSSPYEEAFCIGQHALSDNASCVGWPAGSGVSGS